MRRPGYVLPRSLIFAVLLLLGLASAAPALAFQEASPAAGTPAAEPAATEVVVQVEEPAASTPAAEEPQAADPVQGAAQSNVVTLVLWYANPLDAELIQLYPLALDANFVASPAANTASVGTVDFPEDGVSPPLVVVGDTTFQTYPRADGFIERWTWFDDFEGARPATLVMQLSGLDGTYQNYYGTGTFMSRDEGGAGGVLIVALRPPDLGAVAEEQAAEEVAAEDAAAVEAPAEEVITEEAPVEEVVEPPAEESGIVIEGEPAEPATEGVIEIEPEA